jgi:hypothetical protein
MKDVYKTEHIYFIIYYIIFRTLLLITFKMYVSIEIYI